MKQHISRFHDNEPKDFQYCEICRALKPSDGQHEQTKNVCSVCKVETTTVKLYFYENTSNMKKNM